MAATFASYEAIAKTESYDEDRERYTLTDSPQFY